MDKDALDLLRRVADALDRLSPPPLAQADFTAADAFVWRQNPDGLDAIKQINRIDLSLLRGIDRQIKALSDNTMRFAQGFSANNALLWGARGTGKSSLVKAIHDDVCQKLDLADAAIGLKLVEIHREDIPSLPRLLRLLKASAHRFILFCDDLSFDGQDSSYKSLKAVLEGGVEGRPENVVFYATSNRRHILSRDMIENEKSTAINPHEAVEEKVSLSDRFGLWLGFHNVEQETYFTIIEGYCRRYGLNISPDELRRRANEWSVTRGSRSGRVAWQFIQDLAGELGVKLT